MAAGHQYFYEDEVYRINKRGNIEFGMVLENSELLSSDESDVEELSKMKKGYIRVIWHPSGIEEVVSEKKVGLADRSLMPGDVVRRLIKGKDTQRGYCRHMNVTACVQVVGTNQVIMNVPSNILVSLEELAPDIAVCMDSWVGGIKMIHSKLHLRLPDKTVCVINDPESCGFDVFTDKKNRDFTRSVEYYPGQTLWGPVYVLSDLADWKPNIKEHAHKYNKLKFNKSVKVTVEKVGIESVGVHWQCRAFSREGSVKGEKEQPKVWLQGEDLKRLKLLNVFEPCTLQVGDKNTYVIRSGDEIVTREQWRRSQKQLMTNKGPDPPPVHNSAPLKTAKTPKGKEESKAIEENGHGNDGDFLDDGDDAEWLTDTSDESRNDSDTVSNSSAASTGTVKKQPNRPFTKSLHKKKIRKVTKRRAGVGGPTPPSLPGTSVVVETVSTMSTADVVWQDGSVESGIPSTDLYPIHHLDDQEFFPGDFVIENRDDACMRVYGVIQSVDHAGRTARVRWFRTYTSTDNPQPSLLAENEVSVYDLKDHPDFQYRPGTVVIRVANFIGEDENCTAGQVLDNYPEGRVRVWWSEGHISMCWPQDLYKVGEYDSDEGELWDDVTSDDSSWVTDSEEPSVTDFDNVQEEVNEEESLKPKLAANIEKARVAMSRLEEIFSQNPSLQTTDVMRKLLDVYKDCRYLDKLMGTTFFHESRFEGLIERVKVRANSAHRVQDQVNRLFNNATPLVDSSNNPVITSTPKSLNDNSSIISVNQDGDNLAVPLEADVMASVAKSDDSSIILQSEEIGKTASNVDTMSNFGSSPATVPNVCVKLCSLILGQLLEAHAEVLNRFGGSNDARMSISEAAKSAETSTSSTSSTNGTIADNMPDSGENSPVKSAADEQSLSISKADIKSSNSEQKISNTSSSEIVKAEVTSVPLSSTSINSSLLDDAMSCDPEEEDPCNTNSSLPTPSLSLDGKFSILDAAPNNHKYKLTVFNHYNSKMLFKTLRNEIRLLKTALPSGIWVKGFEDRIDLFSIMIRGPEKTPYEGGLFLFDVQLSKDYPNSPLHCYYISYCSDRLNPNLYEDGKVCVSLLGTWSGKGTEVWTSQSNLLQVLVSIQGLILVSEPYFNEAGYEKQKGSQQGRENSRMYNEMVILKLVQSMTKLASHPPAVFKEEIVQHFSQHSQRLCERLESWLEVSEKYNQAHPISPTTPVTIKEFDGNCETQMPDFPLIPASKGFCLTLRKSLVQFRQVVSDVLVENPPNKIFDGCGSSSDAVKS